MTGPTPTFQKATRRAAKLKLSVQGPSGSGKTLGALALAHGLAQGGRIACIDTENDSASLYADRFGFDTVCIRPPYLTKKYEEAIRAAVEGDYAVLVIDSISHQWEGDGGILQRKDEADARPGSNHWTNWGPFTKEHNRFRSLLLSAPIHIVATMRSKMTYTQTESGGKKKIEKMGLQPIQREGMEYEFTLAFDVQMDHQAVASKDRTGLFTGEVDLTAPATVQRLLTWLETAAPVLPAPTTVPEIRIPGTAKNFSGYGGALVNDPAVPVAVLGKVAKWCRENDPETRDLLIAALDYEILTRTQKVTPLTSEPAAGTLGAPAPVLDTFNEQAERAEDARQAAKDKLAEARKAGVGK